MKNKPYDISLLVGSKLTRIGHTAADGNGCGHVCRT